MTSLADFPINSLAWLVGSAGIYTLGFKSLVNYRRTNNLLTKYIIWFSVLVATALVFFSVPVLFTLDTAKLRYAWVAGEFFVYLALIAQAAILWQLTLRTRVSVYVPTIITGVIGLGAWLNAAPNLTLSLRGNFISYSESGISTFAMALLIGGLYIPVGLHFLRSTLRQTDFKSRLNTFTIGMVYTGIAISITAHLLFYGQVASPVASYGNLAFFIVLLAVMAWPRPAPAKQ